MGRKKVSGVCHLCGKTGKLSFEHVPPESTFNNNPVKVIKGEEIISLLTDNKRVPWDSTGLKNQIIQQGQGGYYLCEDCNNNTGSWYVPQYQNFIYGMHGVVSKITPEPEYGAQIYATDINPLAIFKQIMVMFCDINKGCLGDNLLKDFLLDKTSNRFNKNKYRVFTYIHSGEVQRLNGVFAVGLAGGISYLISEISSYPLGFALYVNLPEGFKPKGCEITFFADYNYETKCNVEIILPVLECNSIISGDYRTKNELTKCGEESRKWMEKNKDLIDQQEKKYEPK